MTNFTKGTLFGFLLSIGLFAGLIGGWLAGTMLALFL